ncbi:hypothetical protein BDQ17DRAFT_1425867 [Cyathus striatus]|nr:hypothetical protein BDQ17DRAFT_1425867 [Cyathus striatus]
MVPNKKKRKAGSAEVGNDVEGQPSKKAHPQTSTVPKSDDEDENKPKPNCEREANAGLQGKLLRTMQWMARDQWELLREVRLAMAINRASAGLGGRDEMGCGRIGGVRQELTTLQGQVGTSKSADTKAEEGDEDTSSAEEGSAEEGSAEEDNELEIGSQMQGTQ